MRLRWPRGDESNSELVKILASEIDETGPITFARFMDIVIRHPRYGYYAASADRVGAAGDFLTAPETHPLFGWLVADQLIEFWEGLGSPESFEVLEDGAGRGTLARQIVNRLVAAPPPGLTSLTYDLSDLNPALAGRIALAASGGELRVGAGDFTAQDAPITGAIIANELLDAFPVHRLRLDGGSMKELNVGVVDGWFADIPGKLSEEALAALPSDLKLLDGQVIEVAPEISDWVRRAAVQLEQGFVLIIDYGYERPAIHDASRFPAGTLKTYRRHDVGNDPFAHIGVQDITTHVDFSAVMEAAERAGLDLEGVTTLAEFAIGAGMDQYLMELQQVASGDDYAHARAAAFALLDPSGLGRFKVAIFSKGVSSDQPLRGLSFRSQELQR